MKKFLFYIATMCLVACGNSDQSGSKITGEFIDLGLRSGTKWNIQNELNPKDAEHGFYTSPEAMSSFGTYIPTIEQWEELQNECQWQWIGSGYRVVGPNGKSITLPAAGIRDYDGSVSRTGSWGFYWSSTKYGRVAMEYLYFAEEGVATDNSGDPEWGLSVRLVR